MAFKGSGEQLMCKILVTAAEPRHDTRKAASILLTLRHMFIPPRELTVHLCFVEPHSTAPPWMQWTSPEVHAARSRGGRCVGWRELPLQLHGEPSPLKFIRP